MQANASVAVVLHTPSRQSGQSDVGTTNVAVGTHTLLGPFVSRASFRNESPRSEARPGAYYSYHNPASLP